MQIRLFLCVIFNTLLLLRLHFFPLLLIYIYNMSKCKNIDCKKEATNGRVYCSLSCRNIYVNKYLRDYSKNSEGLSKKKISYLKNPKRCLKCEEVIPYEKKENKFCGSSCSVSYNNKGRVGMKYDISIEGKNNISSSNKKRHSKSRDKYSENPNKCKICKIDLSWDYRNRKTCSKKCYSRILSLRSRENPNCGGETNYYKYEYKGVSMDSSWEVELAEWMDNEGIVWIRDKGIFFKWIDKEGKVRRYHPDFYLPDYDLYLDPKNDYILEQDQYKLDYVINEYNIKLIYGSVFKIKEYL